MADRQLVVNIGADPEDDLPGVPSPYTEGARIMLGREKPADGWEWRSFKDGPWWPSPLADSGFVEARPIPVPDVVVTLPRDVAALFAMGKYHTDELRAVSTACAAALDADQ